MRRGGGAEEWVDQQGECRGSGGVGCDGGKRLEFLMVFKIIPSAL